ncbi:hypothetical protein AB0B66_33985 [Catellatospora sp. NPDC049111]|uniref:hypothetical protein n=1 Tax=Catellatospora sp. NPDC049111 TaxID=3155271 RepID=UPI0034085586
MSGRKRIVLDESAFFDVRRQAELLSDVRRNAPQYYQAISEQVQQQLRAAVEDADARLAAADEVAANLSSLTRQLEQRTNDELRGESVADDGRAAELVRLREDQAAVTARPEEAARAWLADATAMSELIRTTLPHEQVLPGELDRLSARLAMAVHDVEQRHFASAISVAQNAYLDLSDVRLKIENLERERIAAQASALRGLYLVEALVRDNRTHVVEVAGVEGVPISATIDVDHWTQGELGDLAETVADRIAAVGAGHHPMTAAELVRIADQDVPALESRLSDVVQRAGLRALASQLRVNYADLVARSLERRAGYTLVDGVYMGEDLRGAYVAKLQHPDGSEIVVDVTPTPGDDASCVVRLHSFDSHATADYVLRQRAQAVAAELRHEGVPVADLQSEAQRADPGMRDLEALRQGAAGTLSSARELPGSGPASAGPAQVPGPTA